MSSTYQVSVRALVPDARSLMKILSRVRACNTRSGAPPLRARWAYLRSTPSENIASHRPRSLVIVLNERRSVSPARQAPTGKLMRLAGAGAIRPASKGSNVGRGWPRSRVRGGKRERAILVLLPLDFRPFSSFRALFADTDALSVLTMDRARLLHHSIEHEWCTRKTGAGNFGRGCIFQQSRLALGERRPLGRDRSGEIGADTGKQRADQRRETRFRRPPGSAGQSAAAADARVRQPPPPHPGRRSLGGIAVRNDKRVGQISAKLF